MIVTLGINDKPKGKNNRLGSTRKWTKEYLSPIAIGWSLFIILSVIYLPYSLIVLFLGVPLIIIVSRRFCKLCERNYFLCFELGSTWHYCPTCREILNDNYELAHRYHRIGMVNDAIVVMEKEISENPTTSIRAQLFLGQLYLSNTDIDKALAKFERVILSDRENLEAFIGSAISLEIMNRHEEAMNAITIAKGLAPFNERVNRIFKQISQITEEVTS